MLIVLAAYYLVVGQPASVCQTVRGRRLISKTPGQGMKSASNQTNTVLRIYFIPSYKDFKTQMLKADSPDNQLILVA